MDDTALGGLQHTLHTLYTGWERHTLDSLAADSRSIGAASLPSSHGHTLSSFPGIISPWQ